MNNSGRERVHTIIGAHLALPGVLLLPRVESEWKGSETQVERKRKTKLPEESASFLRCKWKAAMSQRNLEYCVGRFLRVYCWFFWRIVLWGV